ncbi:hypothetical protein E2C01_017738 [Portunus trituberculatus]|uniref:Uncharacterized protein n=1 Tax=Portunus trituberculatus TaxID=210409 RepID=A0A5B7DSS8_PORTR|nr:hypothetical protein [Portunus trituberculatus]
MKTKAMLRTCTGYRPATLCPSETKWKKRHQLTLMLLRHSNLTTNWQSCSARPGSISTQGR